ncbi:hypothetical protein NSS79_01235 [Paenibacillus sp. FSL L8-0436]|uniref:hypothetical protein n=1 Tax=Paenibacillus sp. FSL L8-0436 TaxID=2954686 RepID=UPI0031581EAE
MKDTEYAKFVRLYAPTEKARGRGMQAQFKLPSTKLLGGEYDYINFYCGIGGYEIGISTARTPLFLSNGVYKWHWFVNTSNDDHKVENQPVQFNDGDTVTIKILLDPTTNKLNFYLNGSSSPIYIGTQVYKFLPDCRIVLGASQSSGFKAPLAAWRVFHDNVTVSNIYYRNTADTWVSMASGTLTAFHHPEGVSDANTPAPLNYLTSANGSHMYTGGSWTARLTT